jgi:hypothetical protein
MAGSSPLASMLVSQLRGHLMNSVIGSFKGNDKFGMQTPRQSGGRTSTKGVGAAMSQKALQRLMLTHIPFLKSSSMIPSANTVQNLMNSPGSAGFNPRPIGLGLQGPLGGAMLTARRRGGVNLS